ncbi:CPBP family intramembrane metalloprotease [Paenibacillus zeisoli]|uniref:CPBP family intramembrane metalloprotease n=1 Tax=Paenibacillus zeisoli TaxID=2496267 RepID=A0A3S1JNM8_9BACL|nr:CPBP family intramembrane glutamic endopeptidase [Paenibacillus zeisoli]RUT31575.1 CPBP family intramembrane metalloprotease [Paenibacillus zeisoli]
MFYKISGYKGIIILCLMNLLLNYLVLYPLGLGQYIGPEHPYLFGVINLVIGLIMLAVTILYIRRVDRKTVASLGIKKGRKHLIYSLAAIAITIVLHLVYLKSLDEAGILKAYFNVHYFENAQIVPMLLVTGAGWFVNAFYEEMLRAYIVVKLKHWGPLLMFLTIGLISIAMSIFNGLDLVYSILIFIVSSAFLYVYLKSGSIIPAACAHFIYNFTLGHLFGSGAVAFLRVEGETTLWYGLAPFLLYVIILVVMAKLIYGDASVEHCLKKIDKSGQQAAGKSHSPML